MHGCGDGRVVQTALRPSLSHAAPQLRHQLPHRPHQVSTQHHQCRTNVTQVSDLISIKFSEKSAESLCFLYLYSDNLKGINDVNCIYYDNCLLGNFNKRSSHKRKKLLLPIIPAALKALSSKEAKMIIVTIDDVTKMNLRYYSSGKFVRKHEKSI